MITLYEKAKDVNKSYNNGPVYALVGLVAVLVASVSMVLIFTDSNGDVDRLISFVGTIVPMVLGYAFLSGKVNKVNETAEAVHSQVNGKLDAKFDKLNERLDKVGVPPASETTEDDEEGTYNAAHGS